MKPGPLVRRRARRVPSRRILQRLLQPRAERAIVETIRLRLGQHGEQRIDARLDRPLAQQLRAEAVNRVDVRFLERLEGFFQQPAYLVIRRHGALLLQPFPEPQLQLAGGLLGERHGDDLLHRRAPGREHAQDAIDELRRLAGAGRSLDDERVVEVFDDRTASRGVGQVRRGRARHRIDLSASRSASRSLDLRLTRSSSRGPHTGRKSHHVQARSAGAAISEPCSIARSTIVST